MNSYGLCTGRGVWEGWEGYSSRGRGIERVLLGLYMYCNRGVRTARPSVGPVLVNMIVPCPSCMGAGEELTCPTLRGRLRGMLPVDAISYTANPRADAFTWRFPLRKVSSSFYNGLTIAIQVLQVEGS